MTLPASSDAAPLAQGTAVGDYRVIGHIGEGGFGDVYEVEHVVLQRPAALKVLRPAFATSPDVVLRFLDEARAASNIASEHVVDVHAFGVTSDGRPYFVMELLRGESLSVRLEREQRMSPREVLDVLGPVAKALAAAHGAGVVHRDIKPENIFLVRDTLRGASVKLLDFGVAKWVDAAGESRRKTKTGIPLGTPLYMAPEQCKGLAVDARTDVYAFGAVAFELLTGRPPFEKNSLLELLNAHVLDPVPRVSDVLGAAARELDDVMDRLLAKVPGDRPPSIGAAFDLLATACRRVEPLQAPPPARAAQGSRWLWHFVVAVALASASLVVWTVRPSPPSLLQQPTVSRPTLTVAPSAVGPSSASAAADPPPAIVQIEVQSNVAAAEVWRDGVRIGRVSERIAFLRQEEPLELTLRAGARLVRASVLPDQDRRIFVQFPPAPSPSSGRGGTPKELEDPFR